MAVSHAVSSHEPLGLLLTETKAPEVSSGARALRFEYSSRGDRVLGQLLLPDPRSGPHALIVLLDDVTSPYAGDAFDVSAADWGGRGFAIATLDLPLQGNRQSAKFSERLAIALAASEVNQALDPNGHALRQEFIEQSRCDIQRSLDALCGLSTIDAARIGLFGIGTGGSLCAIVATGDARVRAIALAAVQATGMAELDPESWMDEIAPRAIYRQATSVPDAATWEFFSKAFDAS